MTGAEAAYDPTHIAVDVYGRWQVQKDAAGHL